MLRKALVVLLASILLCGFAVAEPVRVATSEYEPWVNEKSKYGGFVNRVVKEAFARQGVDIVFEYMPANRAAAMVLKGVYPVSSYWFSNPEYDKDYVLSQVVLRQRELLLHLKSRPLPKWHTLGDLAHLKFGATIGYTYTAEFWAMANAGSLKTVVSYADETSLKRLLSGDIDVFPMEEVAARRLLANPTLFGPEAKDRLAYGGKPLKESEGYLRFTKGGPLTDELVAKFHAGLAEIRNDGSYARFYAELLQGIY